MSKSCDCILCDSCCPARHAAVAIWLTSQGAQGWVVSQPASLPATSCGPLSMSCLTPFSSPLALLPTQCQPPTSCNTRTLHHSAARRYFSTTLQDGTMMLEENDRMTDKDVYALQQCLQTVINFCMLCTETQHSEVQHNACTCRPP